MIHVVTAFRRFHLLDTLIKHYEPMGVIWHPITFNNETVSYPDKKWIEPFVIPYNENVKNFIDIGYHKKNEFIQQAKIIDDDYYIILDDDDMIESGVFDKIKTMNNDVIFISLKRGDKIPENAIPIRRYPTDTLIAHPDNIVLGGVSQQQYIVKGAIFKKVSLDVNDHYADGRIAMWLKENYTVSYEPDLYALFNYFEPGRWTKDNKFSFGVIANDPYRLNTVFLKSALPGKAHYLFNPESATKGLNVLLNEIEKEGAEIAILAHQDMYFRNGWLDKVREQLSKLPNSWVVAGIIGKDTEGRMCGKLHDMRIVDNINTCEVHTFPHPAVCFDECVIIVNMKKSFRFDESLDGFDLYGTLCVLQAWEMGGTAWIIDAWAEHYCMRPFSWFPDDTFKARYRKLYDRYIEKFETIDSTVFVNKPRFETSAA